MSWRKIGAEFGLDEGTLRKALRGEADDTGAASRLLKVAP
jgi:hypothetical protein